MYRNKTKEWFESQMALACSESRRVTKPSGIGVFVFASKDTPAWEAMIAALIGSGWIVTASWPIDTEMGTRLQHKIQQPWRHPSTLCADLVRTRKALFWIKKSATGATSWPHYHRVSTTGCRGSLKKASLARTPFSPASDLPSKSSAATAGSKRLTAMLSRSANTWSTSGPPSRTKPCR